MYVYKYQKDIMDFRVGKKMAENRVDSKSMTHETDPYDSWNWPQTDEIRLDE